MHVVSLYKSVFWLTERDYEMSQLFFQDNYYSIYTSERGVDYIAVRSEVLIVPLARQSEVILTIEPSVAFGEPTLVLPGGVVELGKSHEQTALRELQEEIGYTAKRLDFLGEARPFSKYVALQKLYLSGT